MKRFETVRQGNLEEHLWNTLIAEPLTHLFLDYNIPAFNISDALKKIRSIYPHINIIIVSSTCNIFLTQKMLGYGVKAVISKNTGVNELDFCLHSINNGRTYISRDIKLMMNDHANVIKPLNITEGYTIIKTAEALKLSKHTIVSHRRKLMDKTGVNSASGLVRFGIAAGLISI